MEAPWRGLDDRTTGVEALEAEIRGAQYDVLADAAHFLMHFDDRCGRLLLERAYRILDGK